MSDEHAMLSGINRRHGLRALTGLGLSLLHRSLRAELVWPKRPVRLIVVYPSGGVSDQMARSIAQRLTPQLGVPVLVENRAGAGGTVGMDFVAKSPPDGHTLAFSAISPLTLSPHLVKVNYDAQRDFAAVVSVMYTPLLVVGTPAFSGENFADLLRLARDRPGHIRWGSSGSGTLGHMVMELVRLASRTDITHIPYKGGGQQLTDALAGHFEVLSTNVAAATLDYIRSGRFKPLAVGAPVRLPVLPDTPTLAELGYPEANLTSLFGFFAPDRTPPEIVDRLNLEINAVLRQPEFQDRLRSVNNLPAGGSTAEFARQIGVEWRTNAQMIRSAQFRSQ